MQKWAGINTLEKMRLIYLLICLFTGTSLYGQINSGRIVFERKTNLEKKFDDSRMKKMLGDTKSKVDLFELNFNDSSSIFKPIITDDADPLSWVTTKNTTLLNLNTDQKLSAINAWGSVIYVLDAAPKRSWKMTNSKRFIAGYECYKAMWQKDDSTRIYAWYSVDIVPSVGPEGFDGLPGAILGLATEDGGIIYFAKSVEVMEPKAEVFKVDYKKKEVFTLKSLREKFEKEMGSNPMARRMFEEIFRWL